MKIAFLIETFPSTTEVAVLNQVVALIERGEEVTIFTFDKSNLKHADMHRKVFKQTLKIIELPRPKFSKYDQHWKNFLNVRAKAIPLFFKFFRVSPIKAIKAALYNRYGSTRKAFKIIYAVEPLIKKKLSFDVIHCQFAPLGVWGAILSEIKTLQSQLNTG